MTIFFISDWKSIRNNTSFFVFRKFSNSQLFSPFWSAILNWSYYRKSLVCNPIQRHTLKNMICQFNPFVPDGRYSGQTLIYLSFLVAATAAKPSATFHSCWPLQRPHGATGVSVNKWPYYINRNASMPFNSQPHANIYIA